MDNPLAQPHEVNTSYVNYMDVVSSRNATENVPARRAHRSQRMHQRLAARRAIWTDPSSLSKFPTVYDNDPINLKLKSPNSSAV